MKVTVEEKNKVDEIDFSVKQLLIYKRNSGNLIVLCNGNHTDASFEGFVVDESDPSYIYMNKALSFSDKFAKPLFEKFHGTITIEQ